MRIRLARFLLLTSTVICSLLLSAGISSAQDRFPSKPIQLVAPLAPGTTSDLVARILAERLSQRLGQPVVVQNRTGASGSIAGQFVAKSAPDGYTILIVNSQHSANPALFDNLPYDTLRDFTGVALFAEAPSLIVVPTRLNVKTLKEFVALAKSQPGKLNYGTSGNGTTTHVGGALFADRTGINIVAVPYKGFEVITDTVAGRLDAMFVPAASVLQYVRDGRLVALAVTSREPLRTPIELPSAEAAADLPGFEYSTYYGIVAPSGVPRPILDQLSREIRLAAQDKEASDKLSGLIMFPRDRGPDEFNAFLRADVERIGKLIRALGDKAK